MSMKPLQLLQVVYAVLIGAGTYVASQDSSGAVGSCVQGGFTECCNLPNKHCQVNGSCFCNARCHTFNDCCPDINDTCPLKEYSPDLGSCVKAGYTECCSKLGNGCEVNNSCFCNIHCHGVGDCCSDINKTCTPQGTSTFKPITDINQQPDVGSSINQPTVISIAVLSVIIICSVASIMAAVAVFVVIKKRQRKFFDTVIRRVVQVDDAIDNTNYMGFDTVNTENHLPNTAAAIPASTGNISNYENTTHDIASTRSASSYSQPFDALPPQNERMNNYSEAVKAFWKPASQERELRRQCAELGLMNIPIDALTIHEQIGSGEFGTVHRGVWYHSDCDDQRSGEESKEVAVKSMKRGSCEKERVRFLQEATIMGQFNNAHILSILGIITDSKDNNLRIVTDLMHNGDLRTHLTTLKPVPNDSVPAELSPTLLSYSRQVASGVMYLSIKKYIHRDLAARNVLVSSNGTCKIADFGLSRDLQHENYYTSHASGKIPVKWMAPEALLYRTYSTASDVWSYGCLLYEIWSLGAKLYSDSTNMEVLEMLQTGYRLPPPPGCPRNVYQLMMKCWHPNPEMRPNPGAVVAELSHPDYQVLRKTTLKNRVLGNAKARLLGAPLSEGHTLFKDLQSMYSRRDGTPRTTVASSRPSSVPYVVSHTMEDTSDLKRDCRSLELHPLSKESYEQSQQTNDGDGDEVIEETIADSLTTQTDKLDTVTSVENSHSYHLLENATTSKKRSLSFLGQYGINNDQRHMLLSAQNPDNFDPEV